MYRLLVICLVLLLTACSAPVSKEPEVNPEELYSQIKTGMTYNEVMTVMSGIEVFLESDGAIKTPSGQITTKNVSWKIGDAIITVIFQDNKVIGKDLTTP